MILQEMIEDIRKRNITSGVLIAWENSGIVDISRKLGATFTPQKITSFSEVWVIKQSDFSSFTEPSECTFPQDSVCGVDNEIPKCVFRP